MACPNKNRQRPRTVAFRLTDDEFTRLEQRVRITGEVKGDYLRDMALNGEINISVGKFKSDKLALALKGLANELRYVVESQGNEDIIDKLKECQIMIDALCSLMIACKKELNILG